jgi:hypothetical protein
MGSFPVSPIVMSDALNQPLRATAERALTDLALAWGLLIVSLFLGAFSSALPTPWDKLGSLVMLALFLLVCAANGKAYSCASGSRSFGIIVAVCSMVMPLAVLFSIVGAQGLIRIIDDADRLRPDVCPNCGYSRTGLTQNICPECGEQLDARDEPPTSRSDERLSSSGTGVSPVR